MGKMHKSKVEWKKLLTSEQYKVLIEKGTEAPFSGKLLNNKEEGTYVCAACGNKLFESKTKFESRCGWPSFSEILALDSVELKEDNTHSMKRIEVLCKKCGGHLGHLFDDGPKPSRKRYCINSVSLKFKKK